MLSSKAFDVKLFCLLTTWKLEERERERRKIERERNRERLK